MRQFIIYCMLYLKASPKKSLIIFLLKIDAYRSLLPSDPVTGWAMKMMSNPNSNESFINIRDRLIWRRSPNLTRSSKLAAAPNWWQELFIGFVLISVVCSLNNSISILTINTSIAHKGVIEGCCAVQEVWCVWCWLRVYHRYICILK